MEDEEVETIEKRSPQQKSVGDILRLSMKELCEKNNAAYTLLISKADEGFFEEHETRGKLNALADSLLDTLKQARCEYED